VIGISALIVLLLVVCGGGVVGVSTAAFYTSRLKESQMQAEMEAARAQAAFEQAKRAVERQAGKEAK